MTLDLHFEEVFARSITDVWRAITDRDQLARWLMDNDFEPTLGHAFRLREPATAAWRGYIECRVLELEPPHRMVWSWHGGGADEVETRVVFELHAEGAATRLVFRHLGELTPARREMMRTGWTRKLGVLGPVLGPDYARRVAFAAPRARVYDAIASVDGLRGWWTADVARAGDALHFGFQRAAQAGQVIVMRVDEATPPTTIRWTCVSHSALPEWAGTQLTFAIAERADGSELVFRHAGLTPQLACYDHCHAGWDRFLASLVGLVDRGQGRPWV